MRSALDDPVLLIASWRGGDERARNRLLELLQDDLARIATSLLRREHERISLFTGDLVNEAVARLLHSAELSIVDLNHLLALSARVMRNVLLDAARRRGRNKRQAVNVTLTGGAGQNRTGDVDMLALDHALRRLSAIEPARAAIVEMRYFGGMTIEQIAEAQGVSPATVKRSWEAARLWLKDAIENDVG